MASRVDPMPGLVGGGVNRQYLRYSEELLSVSLRKVAVGAIPSTALLFSLLWVLKIAGLDSTPGVGWFLTLFLGRGPIQYITTFAFFSGLWFVVLKVPQIVKESQGFSLLTFPELVNFPYGIETAATVSQKIKLFTPDQAQLAIVRRVSTAFQRLISTEDTSAVHDVLTTLSDIDREIADASYRSVRFILWFIPVAGFLGTVLGISQAISGFSDIVGSKSAISLDAVKPVLADATYNLGVAFDTTLLALALGAILMLAMFYVQRREEVFLSAVDEFCVSELVNKMHVPDPGADKVLTGLTELTNGMVSSIDSLAGDIRADFKKLAGTLEKRDEERIPKLIETIEKRFEKFMTDRDKSDTVFQTQLAQLLSHLGNIVERGKSVEGFVAGLGELANLEKILSENQNAIKFIQKSMEKQQTATREAFTQGHDQVKKALEQNIEAFDRLLPPLEELATGIKIKVGE